MSGRRFSLLDRRRYEHDFGVQPGLPPSNRKSVNDRQRHDVSNRSIGMCRVAVYLRFIYLLRKTTRFRGSLWLAAASLTGMLTLLIIRTVTVRSREVEVVCLTTTTAEAISTEVARVHFIRLMTAVHKCLG